MKTVLQYYCYFLIYFVEVHSQALYYFPHKTDLVAVNGSSSTGGCHNFTNSTKQCLTPTSSVLCDGNVSTLTSLDGDIWASQLLTMNTTESIAEITFNFTKTDYKGVRRVEVVMFNCPEWGISVETITLFCDTSETSPSESKHYAASICPITTSCDSLVRVCISHNSSRPVLTLAFTSHSTSNWIHLAEVTFNDNDSTCPPDAIITSSGLSTTQCELCPFCCPTTTFIIAAIVLVAGISVVVQIAVYMLYRKSRSGGARVPAGGKDPMNENGMKVMGDKEVKDHIYDEVEWRGREMFPLKKNEAYVTFR